MEPELTKCFCIYQLADLNCFINHHITKVILCYYFALNYVSFILNRTSIFFLPKTKKKNQWFFTSIWRLARFVFVFRTILVNTIYSHRWHLWFIHSPLCEHSIEEILLTKVPMNITSKISVSENICTGGKYLRTL